MTADEIKALVKRVLRELDSAFIDVTIHAQDAFALVKYVRDLQKERETLTQDIEDLKHDNASMLDSLTKESTARCEAEDALAALTLENQRLHAEAARYRWSTDTEDNASTLHSILLCHAGDQAKIDARVDEYRNWVQIDKENPEVSSWPYNSRMQNVAKGGR